MGKPKGFRTIGAFAADDPDRLDEQLPDLEDNINAALLNARQTTLGKPTPTNAKTADYIAQLGDFARLDSSLASLKLTLPVATAINQGQVVLVSRQSALNSITVLSAKGTINGAATVTLPASTGLYLFMSDGVGWWFATGGVLVQDEGLAQGSATTFNFGGAGVTVTVVNGVATVTVTTITEATLSAAILPIRLEMENLRHLLLRLVQIELGSADLGGAADNLRGSEQLNA